MTTAPSYPDEFDITRSNAAEQLGFGYGIHGRAGQGLARLEGHAVLRALVEQVTKRQRSWRNHAAGCPQAYEPVR